MTDGWSDDWFLGGRLLLRQPLKGHRIGTDALLLAAISPAAGRICDFGAGVGAVGLALAARGAGDVVLVEREPTFAAHARHNIAAGDFADRVSLAEMDVFDRRMMLAAGQLADQTFDVVATNPPYDQSLRGRRPASALKLAAHAMRGGDLTDWLAAAARLLAHGGMLTMIHRADMIGEVLAAMPRRMGGVVIRPVLPRPGEPSTRILVRAAAGSRARTLILPPFVLHGPDGAFTADAKALHEGRATLRMSPGPELEPAPA